MPYIEPKERPRIDRGFDALDAAADIVTLKPGELNYLLTRIVRRWTGADEDTPLLPVGYGPMAEAIGALECVKLEFYRRSLAPYEDEKRAENGDLP